MKLKKAIIEVMGRDQLKQVCDDLEISDVDRRSREEMGKKVSRMRRASPALLFGYLLEPEVKAVCELMGESPTGRRNALIEHLLNLDAGPPPGGEEVGTGRTRGTAPPSKAPSLKPGPQTSVVAETTEPLEFEEAPDEQATEDTSSSIPQSTPDIQSVLRVLTRERLYDLGRVFGAGLRPARERASAIADGLAVFLGSERLMEVLRELGRDELRAVCRAHGLPTSNRKRAALIEQLATAAGLDGSASVVPRPFSHNGVPVSGQVMTARGRQWLVEEVIESEDEASPLLRLACLDDDAPGKPLEILWDLELGARVIEPEAEGLGAPTKLDPPSHFGAYLIEPLRTLMAL